MEIFITLVILAILWNFYDDYQKQHPKKKPLPDYKKDIDYDLDDSWFTYSPELIKLNQFKAMKTDYLASVTWSHKRQAVLARDSHKCTNCGSTENLNIHHLRYAQVPNEPISELITLCQPCHKELHDTVGYPQVYQDYTEKSYLPPWK